MTDPRTITLENALKALGINPDNDPIYHAKRWIEGRDTDRRERDQALTERDNAAARVAARDQRIKALEGERDAALKQAEENKRWGEQYRQALNHFFIKMGLNQNADLDQHMAHVAKVCESFDTLTKIRLIFGQPDDVVGVIKSVCVELDNANDRADKAKATLAELRAEIHKALDDYSTPTHYNATKGSYGKGAEIPVAERARIGLMILWAKWSEAEQKAQEASYHLDVLRTERTAAQNALDTLEAPRQAGNYDLDPAARIRALPR